MRAYSDTADHVIVKLGNTEHGMDLPCARELLNDLFAAIIDAPNKPKAVDPGEGWRLLNNGDIIQVCDEIHTSDGWLPAHSSLGTVISEDSPACRRRIEPLLEKCPEGHEAILEISNSWFFIQCNNPNCMWRGRKDHNRDEPIASWNSVMRAYRESKQGLPHSPIVKFVEEK